MSLLDTASLILTPNGYKASKLYSVKPTDASGDMTVVRATTATRVNSAGLIESVAINAPRLDYTGGGCPKILVEPERINRVLYSEQFDNAYWVKNLGGVASAPVVTPNVETAPDGTTTADRVVFNLNGGTASGDFSQLDSALFASISITRTQSVYIKTTDGTTKIFSFVSPTGTLATITVTSVYQRFTFTSTGINSSSIRLRLRGGEGTSTSASIAIWGAQYEDGSNATSYIPTVAGTVTRNADSIIKTGISSLIGQTEGTLFANVIGTKEITANNKFICIIGGTKNIHIAFYSSLINVVSSPIDISVGFTPNVNYKIAVRYLNTGNFRVYVNGVKTHEVNTYVGGTFNNLGIGNTIAGSSQVNSSINSVQLYKTALTHEQCISLTT